ncbi:MAG: helix-turn-helix domain-containing protein [Myxococcales bacterium]|nr:helix-turn-helix domain-containing protein [Myxococcales bacterium]
MSRSQDLRLLELEAGASFLEVEEAYRRLMRRYCIGGLASYGLLRVDDRRRFLSVLQESYQRLRESAHETQVDNEPRKQPSFPDLTPFSPESVLRAQEEASAAVPESLGQLPDFLVSESGASASLVGPSMERPSHLLEGDGASGRSQEASPLETKASIAQDKSSQGLGLGGASSWQAPSMQGLQAQSRAEQARVEVRESVVVQEGPFTGAHLRKLREEKSISLEWIARRSGLPHEKIAALEADRYEMLGSSRQIRAILTFYTRALDIEPRQVFIDYLASYWGWRSREGMRHS